MCTLFFSSMNTHTHTHTHRHTLALSIYSLTISLSLSSPFFLSPSPLVSSPPAVAMSVVTCCGLSPSQSPSLSRLPYKAIPAADLVSAHPWISFPVAPAPVTATSPKAAAATATAVTAASAPTMPSAARGGLYTHCVYTAQDTFPPVGLI